MSYVRVYVRHQYVRYLNYVPQTSIHKIFEKFSTWNFQTPYPSNDHLMKFLSDQWSYPGISWKWIFKLVMNQIKLNLDLKSIQLSTVSKNGMEKILVIVAEQKID